MPPTLIPFRTYLAAAALSLVVNLGAAGTFATFRVSPAARNAGGPAVSDSQPLVISDLSPLTPEPTVPEKPTPDEPESQPDSRPPEIAPPALPPPPKPDEPQTKLGNPDAPDSSTQTWIGVSKDPGTPRGVRGTIDQAQFKPGLPGTPADASPPSPQLPTSAAGPVPPSTIPPTAPLNAPSNPTPESRSSESLPAPSPFQPDPIPADNQPWKPAATTSDPFEATLDAVRVATTRFARQLRNAIEHASQPKPDVLEPANASQPVPPAPAAAAPSPPASLLPTRAGENGNGADRESDAFSKTDPVDVRPGQPLAGKGLSIKTVAPRWTTSTRILYQFRNPVIRVKFGRHGKVIHAAFLPGKDAGHPDVSGPLLDAIYRWTAQGDELSSIPANEPQSGISITFHVILN